MQAFSKAGKVRTNRKGVEKIMEIVVLINERLGFITAMLLLLCGVLFTIKTKLFPLFKIKYIFKNTFGNMMNKQDRRKSGISSFKSFAMSIAGTIGIGNIVGVTAAIAIGGPGAVFWIWVSAFFVMMIKYAEIFFSVKYRYSESGVVKSENIGALSYISRVVKSKPVLKLYAFFGITVSLCMGNMVQANSFCESFNTVTGISPFITGAVFTLLFFLLIKNSGNCTASVLSVLVPLMSAVYVIGGLIIICLNISELPNCIYNIFRSAIAPAPAAGAFTGATIAGAFKNGTSNGLFSNEAGLGSSAFAHGLTREKNPAKEGLWGIFEVFADSILISTITAFIILTSNVWTENGSVLTAFTNNFGKTGTAFVTVSLFLFAVSSMLSWSYYGKLCANYISKKIVNVYIVIFIICTFAGTVCNTTSIWLISEITNSLMLLINLYAVFRLRKEFICEINKVSKPSEKTAFFIKRHQ